MILLIDDDELGVKARKDVLRVFGYDSVAALTGAEGLHEFRSSKIDLVILDYHLPDMSGDELMAGLRAAKPSVPLILLSGRVFIPDSAMSCADGFLRKGEEPRKIQKLLERYLPTCAKT
ncbi:response regulator [Granulicella sibirica]|uniref:Two-component response regulator n=1 Tax=Granulicella sibirica TaxID=2479048 RepID=A0A4Q0SZT3_9BACT|nr:response regulator [Granulicella sibirica]RXH56833.1 two-component response regulator [Granulicella sibirica]